MTKTKPAALPRIGTDLARRHAELAELRTILDKMPEDPLAKPLLASRVRSMEAELQEFETKIR